jgi:ribonuclease HII
MKLFPDYTYEAEALSLGFTHPVGIDEVGRGACAGPVVAAAVYMPPNTMSQFIGRVTDSKQLMEAKRVELARELSTTCDIGIGVIDQKIIDAINILEATKLAMKMALYDLDIPYDYLFIDGPIKLKSIATTQCPIIKGDSKVLSIAAASVVAKVIRDRIMYELDKIFPIYGWKTNKAYGTKQHLEAIRLYGPCEYHRLTFRGVKEYI